MCPSGKHFFPTNRRVSMPDAGCWLFYFCILYCVAYCITCLKWSIRGRAMMYRQSETLDCRPLFAELDYSLHHLSLIQVWPEASAAGHFLSLFPTVVTYTAWLHTVQQNHLNMNNNWQVCRASSLAPAIRIYRSVHSIASHAGHFTLQVEIQDDKVLIYGQTHKQYGWSLAYCLMYAFITH